VGVGKEEAFVDVLHAYIQSSSASRCFSSEHNDGLVYNYGNSLSANFTGDAKNVIKIANIIYF